MARTPFPAGQCHTGGMPTPEAAEFRILGPLEVGIGEHRLELGGTRQQVVLAMLLLSANGAVSVDRLEEAIYGEDLPPTARAQVQISISALRRLLAAHAPAVAISTQAQGYVLQVEAGAGFPQVRRAGCRGPGGTPGRSPGPGGDELPRRAPAVAGADPGGYRQPAHPGRGGPAR